MHTSQVCEKELKEDITHCFQVLYICADVRADVCYGLFLFVSVYQ